MYGKVKLIEKVAELHEGSHKKVRCKCIQCNEIFLREYRHINKLHQCPTTKIINGLTIRQCTVCKKWLNTQKYTLFSTGNISRECKQCVINRRNNLRYGSLANYLHHHFLSKQRMAKLSGQRFLISEQFLVDLWDAQNGCCYYTKIPLDFSKRSKLVSPSLDRLDSSLDYTIDNTIWCSRAINLLKNNSSLEEYADFMEAWKFVANYRPIRSEFKKIHPNAKIPTRSMAGDVGYDLYCVLDVTINPSETKNIRTGIKLSLPIGFYATIEGRSSMFKHGIYPARGIIDSTYCGEMLVALTNHSNKPYNIGVGDRIAQLVVHKTKTLDIVEVEEFSPEYSIRGNAGFGSSGK